MTTTATGPDSAFFPEDTLPRVTPPARPADDDLRTARPGHEAGPTQWLQHAMAIWLAPEAAPSGAEAAPAARPSSAH